MPPKPLVAKTSTLTVSSQQSRFQPDPSGASALSKEVVVKDLTLTLGAVDLLSHASFQLQPGRHYVLHGRNGVGKSTLLRAMNEGKIASFPRGLKVLLLGQTQTEEEFITQGLDGLKLNVSDNGAPRKEMSVLEFVVRSNAHRETLKSEAERLRGVLTKEDAEAIAHVYKQIIKERTERKLEEARSIAERRSGARGATARRELNKVEDELTRAEQDLHSGDASGAEVKKAGEMLEEVQSELELMDASSAESQARAVLLGLGFSVPSLSQPRSQLSGGWRTRSLLACALCQTPDLLLLDEPTNFLDLPSILWLETHLTTQLPASVTLILTTHDRTFADALAHDLLVLRAQSLTTFKGNLSSYELARYRTFQHMTRLAATQEKTKSHLRAQIAGNLAAARRAGDDKKLKQAASRKKKLDERMGLEISAKGTRFKLNRDHGGFHNSARAAIEIPDFDPWPPMGFPASPPDLRFPGALVSLEKVGFGFGKLARAPGNGDGRVLREVDLTVHPGDRIGVCGLNGSGKSTLVSLVTEQRAPAEGTVTRHSRVRIGVYSQQAVEELEALAGKRAEVTALALVMEESAELQEKDARGLLAGLGLAGRTASDVPIALLSGGQKVRLALARLFAGGSPHLLILDEVTTHLDTDTIQALVTALKSYEGAIMVITHDRFFMRCVVEGASMRELAVAARPGDEEDEPSDDSDSDDSERGGSVSRVRIVYRLSKGKLSKLERGMEQYEEIAARSATKLGKV